MEISENKEIQGGEAIGKGRINSKKEFMSKGKMLTDSLGSKEPLGCDMQMSSRFRSRDTMQIPRINKNRHYNNRNVSFRSYHDSLEWKKNYINSLSPEAI